MKSGARRPAALSGVRTTLLLLALAGAGFSAHAGDVDLDVDGKPEEACLNTEKTLRMVMNIWANGATDTYAQVKPDIEKELGEKGERGAKVLAVYHEMIPRIESGEFLPPKVVSRYEGHQKLRAAAHVVCMKALSS